MTDPGLTEEEQINYRIVALLNSIGSGKYGSSNDGLLYEVQMTRPRCMLDCPCSRSKAWRKLAIAALEFLELPKERRAR